MLALWVLWVIISVLMIGGAIWMIIKEVRKGDDIDEIFRQDKARQIMRTWDGDYYLHNNYVEEEE